MIAVIQTVPERLERAKWQAMELGIPCEIYVDENKEGTLPAFIQTLRRFPQGNQYRLHMQDDLLFCDRLAEHLPRIVRDVSERGIHYLTLYCGKRIDFTEIMGEVQRTGEHYKDFKTRGFTEIICFLMSPQLHERLLEDAPLFPSDYPDDVVLAQVINRAKWKTFYHLPSLVQHDITVPSSLGHKTTKKQQSKIFDREFFTRN